MAQTEFVLDQGIGELILLWSGAAATKMSKIVGLDKATVITAAVGSTFAAPGSTSAHHTEHGLEIAAIDTVAQDTTNTAGDTILFDHVLTATDTENLAGIQTCNEDGDKAYHECGFNAVLAMENTDTCTIDGQSTIEQA